MILGGSETSSFASGGKTSCSSCRTSRRNGRRPAFTILGLDFQVFAPCRWMRRVTRYRALCFKGRIERERTDQVHRRPGQRRGGAPRATITMACAGARVLCMTDRRSFALGWSRGIECSMFRAPILKLSRHSPSCLAYVIEGTNVTRGFSTECLLSYVSCPIY